MNPLLRISTVMWGWCVAVGLITGALSGTVLSAEPTVTSEAYGVAEVGLASTKRHSDPFNWVSLQVVVTPPSGPTLTVPAFWDGENRWAFRYASGQLGRHRFRTVCSDPSDSGLHGVEGSMEITAYRGENPLLRHGPIRVANDHRHFEHSDGTPFFWLGDTWWKGLCGRIDGAGFRRLAADRCEKGFSVIQIVAGPYPDEPLFDDRWGNEGGLPYDPAFSRPNPKYFEEADRRLTHLVKVGLMPAIVGSWGMHLPAIGVEKMKRHWRYLLARYGAYPVVWIVAGEAVDRDGWCEITRFVQENDPYHRVVTLHPPIDSARRHVGDKARLDFDLISTGHGGWEVATRTVGVVTNSRAMTPPMPVLVGEVCYEGHMMTHGADFQRYQFWSSLLSGAAGHTYGAGGIWQMNSETVRGGEYEFTPWFEAMHLPGARQIGLAKLLLEQFEWWRFEPHPEWVGNRGFAAGIPGQVHLLYLPYRAYDWAPPVVRQLESEVSYRSWYWEPSTGRRFDLGRLERPTSEVTLVKDDFDDPSPERTPADAVPPGPRPESDSGAAAGKRRSTRPGSRGWSDQGTATRVERGRLVGGKGLVTVGDGLSESNLLVRVSARSDAEAGLVMRYRDPDHYLVALYSPSLKALYLHDRVAGVWGESLGKVSVPDIGPEIRLTALVNGAWATASLSDGHRSYATPTVAVRSSDPGSCGVWCFQVGERQEFDDFECHRLVSSPASVEGGGSVWAMAANPYVGLPAAKVPPISWLLSDVYTPPRLPAPQDWVLVLARDRK